MFQAFIYRQNVDIQQSLARKWTMQGFTRHQNKYYLLIAIILY